MSIDTDTSLETWELTLPEEDAECVAGDGRRASWFHRFPCGHGVQLCDPHHEMDLDEYATRPDTFFCNACNAPMLLSAVRWHRI